MKTRYGLLEMRDVWIDAYMNGDIDQLKFVESPHFFVKRGDRILTRLQQISAMQRHLSEKTWRGFSLQVRDEITAIEESPLWASISGTGSMQRGEGILTRFDFLELWLVNDDRWQIAALCYEEKEYQGGGTTDHP
ncbi:hypothetical protein GQ57_22065 [Burkholderia sp. MSh2]|uniref:DUF4440 domain-containing protein n=1 Tax=Burkholderia paludis TaxID=1506587 RepID=A0A6P2LRN9_9BURK|nr:MULTISPECIES: hypothetical protein [Burkholderia]KEZ03713.1 hypothetical protein GQ57_22065 [Burkholderia sp. MSh2]KFG95508.1 hypothetical protein GQ56_0120665 [Burkholderia paludis]CAB3763082.1 hypothetical protein LMG30113_04388 [Burkholderia paludis]VWB69872.1 hypothetical protein BPA30113_03142 [Burkholderia paludis]